MAVDLTAITTPFGLLDAETQEALRAHGGPYEWYMRGSWKDAGHFWGSDIAYRVKPHPPKPREWWIVIEDKTGRRWVHDSIADLDRADLSYVRVREVLE